VRTADPCGLLAAEAGHGFERAVHCSQAQVQVQDGNPHRNAVYYFVYFDTFPGKRGKIHGENLLDTS
jgi:hypothetical protein